MRKPIAALSATVVVFAFLICTLMPTLSEGASQDRCPVLGGPANKRVYTDYQGKRIYFCCPPCIKQFQKDPEKYIKQLEKEGVVLQDMPHEGKVRPESKERN